MGNKTAEERNMELMQTLDDAWNAQDLETFSKRHRTDVVVRWPGKGPTNGVDAHRIEAIQFFKTFPDQHLGNRPYKTFFASGDWTCSIAHFTGTMKGPMSGPAGKEIPPDRQEVRRRLLHSGPLGQQRTNHRGESLLRSDYLHETNRPGVSW